MKKQTVFALLVVLVLALSACGTPPPATPTTPTLLPTQQTVIPTDITYPTFTPAHVATAILYSTLTPIQTEPIQTEIPYPTASVVNANAVAFIERDNETNLSLWVANVDGSGERKIVESIGEWSDTANYFLRWSPRGKWISYISNDELWIISPDGSEKKKVLSASDNNKRLISYNWAPDDSKVAYVEISLLNSKFDSESVKILNLGTGEIYEVSTNKPQFYGTILRWSPNGQLLAYNKDTTFVLFDVTKHKVKQEISIDTYFCSSRDNTAPVWSPNSEYFFHTHSAAAHYTSIYMCISKMDGSTNRVELDGTIYSDVVWDKTGNFIYFVVRKVDQGGNAYLESDQRLQRYNVETQKLDRLLSLGQRYISGWYVSISPDGSILQIHTEISKNEWSYIFVDLRSLSVIEKITLEFHCVWANDSKNFICLSESNDYTTFNRLNIQTNKLVAFSGAHKMVSWIISPVATTP